MMKCYFNANQWLERHKDLTRKNAVKMKINFGILFFVLMLSCTASKEKPDDPSIRSILLEQLRNTHSNKDWFVPAKMAVEGLTAEQANWKDSTNNHSIAELVSHLAFWNERMLIAFQGDTPPNFNDDNEITFQQFDADTWQHAVHQLDSILLKWEQVVASATDEQLNGWSSSIANMCSHNAYHTGQILYIRKRKGWWEQ